MLAFLPKMPAGVVFLDPYFSPRRDSPQTLLLFGVCQCFFYISWCLLLEFGGIWWVWCLLLLFFGGFGWVLVFFWVFPGVSNHPVNSVGRLFLRSTCMWGSVIQTLNSIGPRNI